MHFKVSAIFLTFTTTLEFFIFLNYLSKEDNYLLYFYVIDIRSVDTRQFSARRTADGQRCFDWIN